MRRSIIRKGAAGGDYPHSALTYGKPTYLHQMIRKHSKTVLAIGAAFNRVGDAFHSTRPFEGLMRMPRCLGIEGKRPTVLDNCFIAPSASVIGNVCVGRKNYIGYNAIIRADPGQLIVLGESCNVQEKAVVTGAATIGKWCSIEPMAVVESADIAAGSFVGANAVVGCGAKIESEAMLCAAGVLQPGATIPSGEIWAGNPAQKIGTLTEEEKHQIVAAAKHHVLLNIQHHDSWELPWELIDNMRITREMWFATTASSEVYRLRPHYQREPPVPNKHRSRGTTPQEDIVGDGEMETERPTRGMAAN